MEIHKIATAHNGYNEKFGIPRQSGCVDIVLTTIIFEKDYRQEENLRGIEQWSHLWLIWGFSKNEGWSPTVRPPRLGGNKRLGVFATRSSYRPNKLGLSSVKLVNIEKTKNNGTVLIVSGADLMNGTPIYDIKPYLPYTDIHNDATSGFAPQPNDKQLNIQFSEDLRNKLSDKNIADLQAILAQDPRPQYHNDPKREYGLSYDIYNIHFRVEGNNLFAY